MLSQVRNPNTRERKQDGRELEVKLDSMVYPGLQYETMPKKTRIAPKI